jgi:hypothetical protein
MTDPSYASRFRFLDADDVIAANVDFDGLDVYGADGQPIGNVEGFIVDAQAQRACYIVVDSGGWFTSRRLLLPIGHASLSPDRKSLKADVSRDALRRLPEFDEMRFRDFTDDELRAFERNTVLACCPDEPLEDVSETAWGYDSRRHYAQPDWWSAGGHEIERFRPIGYRPGIPPETPPARADAVADRHTRELVIAREGAIEHSPHFEGRAQPGDVLGIETGGERTGIGDTSDDENRRRRDAETAVRDEPVT